MLCATAVLLAALFLAPAAPVDELRVLFIGNSLTAANDMPHIVEAMARAARVPMQVATVTFPNHSLDDHWARGDARRAIDSRPWTHVVLQQGPSALPESRVALIRDVERFDRVIRRRGAKTCLLTVWPSAARSADFPRVIESYALAADRVHGLLIPAGAAWREAWKLRPSLALYSEDGFHPSHAGSLL